MAEPEAKPGGIKQPGESAPPAAAPSSSSPSEAFKTQDIFLGIGIPSSDDTPTIITRGSGSLIRSDDALAGVLRGRQLAHFELLEPIGMGGMAAVIRARDTQLDRSVALKILPPDMAAD